MLRLSAIGDVCNTVPLIRNLQDAWPQTRITWLIGLAERSLVGDLDGIEFLGYDKRAGLLDGLPPRQRLREMEFDVLLHLQASWRANALAWHVRAPIKLGFDRKRARDGQWLFTNQRIAAKPRSHVAEGFLSFGDALGVPRRGPRWDIPLAQADRDFARQRIPDGRPTLLISPCSSQRARNFRNWSAENYAEVARTAMDTFGMRVILTGGRTDLERKYGERIGAMTEGRVSNLIGQTSLKQLLALIERATAVLAPDSGPVHMASTVGTPAIGLYATSNPARTGPVDPRWTVNVYEQALDAFSGTTVRNVRWGQRVRDPGAMDLIKVEAVVSRVRQVLDSAPRVRSSPSR